MTVLRYVLRTDVPFRGSVQSCLSDDGTVMYSGGLTVEQYTAERGFPVRIIDEAELTEMLDAFHATLKTAPKPITEKQWRHALEVLPPCRWHTVGGFEVFHISERVTGTLAAWYAHQDGLYWEFTDDAGLTDAELVAKLLGTAP